MINVEQVVDVFKVIWKEIHKSECTEHQIDLGLWITYHFFGYGVSEKEFADSLVALSNWQLRRTGCYSDLLFDLFQKSDACNHAKLTKVYPGHELALRVWAADCGGVLFKVMGLE